MVHVQLLKVEFHGSMKNQHQRLHDTKALNKRITQDHIASKPDMLLHSETKLRLTLLFDEEENKDLLCKIVIIIMCFGSLYHMEILLIDIKDVTIN